MDMQGGTATNGRRFLDHSKLPISLFTRKFDGDGRSEHLQGPSFARTGEARAVRIDRVQRQTTHRTQCDEPRKSAQRPPGLHFDHVVHLSALLSTIAKCSGQTWVPRGLLSLSNQLLFSPCQLIY